MPASLSTELRRGDVQTLLDLLGSILERSSKAPLGVDDLWKLVYNHDDTFPPITSSDDVLEGLRSSRAQLVKFKRVSRTLRFLADSLEEANDQTENCITSIAMQFGLAGLPEELLSRILWHAASTFQEAIQLSAVCTRFRSATISSPEIWAKFPLMMNMAPAQVATIVGRGGTLPLKARIEPILYFPLNANAVLEHFARLQDLTISPVNDPTLHPQFTAIHLPAVTTLRMKWSKYAQNDRAVQSRIEQPNSHIYETWSMPRLRFLEVDFVPRFLPGTSIGECRLCFGEDSIHVYELLVFLRSLPALKKVELSFSHTTAWRDSTPDPTAHLPNLRSLSINLAGKTPTSLINRILSNLSCEGVTEVSFDMKAGSYIDANHRSAYDMVYETTRGIEEADIRGWSRTAIQFIQGQRCIRSLSITVDAIQGKGCGNSLPLVVVEVISGVLSNIPSSLETLILSRSITVRWDISHANGRKIDCIRASDANPATIELLRIIGTIILRHTSELGRVIVERCTQSQENAIRALLAFSHTS